MKKEINNKLKILEKELEQYKDELDFQVVDKLISNERIKSTLDEIISDFPIKDNSIKEIYIMNLTKNTFLRELLQFYLEANSIIVKSLGEENEYFFSSSFSQYMKEIGRYPLLTESQEKEYFTKLKNGETQYQEIIIKSNLRLVVSIAKRYITAGYGIEDLIQDGNMGLLKAMEKYDVTKGYKFSTYATWWIRQAINRSIADNGRTIRIPVHRVEELRFYKKCMQELYLKYGTKPSEQELANYMTLKKENLNNKKYTPEDIRSLEKDDTLPTSLEIKVGEGCDIELGEMIEDENKNVEDEVMKEHLKQDLNELIKVLSEREQKIIAMRFGLNGEEEKTLQETGKLLHITRERVRQIEAKAIKKLQSKKYAIKIKDYIN